MHSLLLFTAISLFFSFGYTQDAQKESKSSPEKPEHYSIPVEFRPEDVGVKQLAYEFSWDLTNQNKLDLGPVTIDSKSLSLALLSQNNMPSFLAKETLVLSSPEHLFPNGKIEIIGRDGTIFWSASYTENDAAEWRKKVASAISEGNLNPETKKILEMSSMGFQNLVPEALAAAKGNFRFCLTREEATFKSMLCSVRHGLITKDDTSILAQIEETNEPRVFVQKAEASKKGATPVKPGEVVSFFAETASGAAFEFTDLAPTVDIYDVEMGADGKVLLRGYGAPPVGAVTTLGENETKSVRNYFGWQQTIGESRQSWQITIFKESPLIFNGPAGGIFLLKLEFGNLPTADDRVWLSKNDLLLSYQPTRVLNLYKHEAQQVTANAPDIVTPVDSDPQKILWTFTAPKELGYNKSSLSVTTKGRTFKSSLDVFRNYSSEASARLTAASGNSGSSLLLGEASYNHWFQTAFGINSQRWSTLRWGTSVKYFKNFSSAEKTTAPNEEETVSNIEALSLSLKYRFNQGLWGRDETVGILADYQNLNLSDAQASILGLGLFWARSMPRVFDNLLNSIPLFRYPKFVDMEISYYPASLDSSVTLGSTYQANFHGKIFWTDAFFGEGGFAFKSYSLETRSPSAQYAVNIFTLTAGLGLNF